MIIHPLLLIVATPLAGALLIALSAGKPTQRETVTLVTAGLLFWQVLRLLAHSLGGGTVSPVELAVMPGVPLALSVEPLGLIFALVASGLWIVNSVYSIGYMRGNNEAHQTRFYVCFGLAISFAMGIALADNLFTLFLFYEALTLSTYPLVTHKGGAEAREAGRVYLGILMSTSIGFLLLAIVWTWQATGRMDFTPGGILAGHVDEPEVGLLLFLFMYGIGKAALMPIHRWLPAAMVAPTPVSALLHAVAVVKAGVFSVVKVIVYIFGLDLLNASPSADWLLYAAGATILIASLIALKQDNLKRRLAYSTISQLSYVILAAAILAPLSVAGAALHIAAHAVGKITLFFAAGSIYTAAHKTQVSQLDGIGRRMPWTMGAFAIGALSMVGVPPTAGFLSKWFMLSGAWATEQWVAVGVIVLSTLLNAAYFLPIVYAAFFRAPPPDDAHHPPHGEAPWPIVAALTTTAGLTVLLFLFPRPVLDLALALVGATP
ncbi:monovalent cation/H+ antiporter subunit D family protein [Roseospirillum parvum]|uniref:Multicomponent Na+:H+ antiporter subunit D n=1 Tax=Roseospirillum parvum TaxID=83401 RepID=A0A1G7XLF9_9PROT|nr:monovalent cation/H+ antiporter subunit D family protein [Roseospirillum parvum]SDG84873.1 multicomponent Na+:H+ antiporter subunit D [Roseospirillum parvum]